MWPQIIFRNTQKQIIHVWIGKRIFMKLDWRIQKRGHAGECKFKQCNAYKQKSSKNTSKKGEIERALSILFIIIIFFFHFPFSHIKEERGDKVLQMMQYDLSSILCQSFSSEPLSAQVLCFCQWWSRYSSRGWICPNPEKEKRTVLIPQSSSVPEKLNLASGGPKPFLVKS